jgi:hypothetical protein
MSTFYNDTLKGEMEAFLGYYVLRLYTYWKQPYTETMCRTYCGECVKTIDA